MNVQPIEYQHFANLVERVAVYTERLENVCKNLEQYKVEIRTDIKDIDERVKKLEANQDKHTTAANTFASIAKYLIGAVITGITLTLYYRMGGH